MAGGYSVTISATDKVSGTINAINRQFMAFHKTVDRLMAPTVRFQASLSKFGEVSGLNRVTASMQGLGRAAGFTAGRLAEVVPVLGIITGAASVAGMSRLVSSWSEWGLRISNTSRQIGVGQRQLSEWEGAAKMAGGTADAVAGGLGHLGQTLYDVTGGRNVQAGVMLRTLFGQDFKASAHNATELLPQIADKLARVRDPFTRMQIGTELLGGAFQGLEPLLVLGSKRMEQLTRVSREYGYVTDAGVEKAKDLELAQRTVGVAVDGLRNRIAEGLSPILTPMLTQFARWVATSPVVTHAVDALGRGVAWLGDKLEHIDWDRLGKRADEWGDKLLKVLGVLQRFGILPDLGGVFGDDKKAPPSSPSGKGFGENGPTAPAPAASGSNGFLNWAWNTAFDWNPLHWNRDYHPPTTPGANAPNGVPPTGPRFGPQTPGYPGQVQPMTFDTTLTPEARGLLDTIGRGEARSYTSLYGDSARSPNQFTDLSRFPQWSGATVNGAPTHAAGRYQFQPGTYAEAARSTGLYDMSPTSQNRNAWWLAQRDYKARTGRDLATDIKSGDPSVRAGIGQALHPTWTSINGGRTQAELDRDIARQRANAPGGRYADEMYERQRQQLQNMLPPSARGEPGQAPGARGPALEPPAAKGAPMQLNTSSGQGSSSDNGQSTVRVEFGGTLPKGIGMNIQNPSKVDVSGPLVERPSLLGAMP